MPEKDSLNRKIIESLKALPVVTLSTDQKAVQLGSIASAIAAGTIMMKSFPLHRLLLDRAKEELAKYLVFTVLVSTIFAGGTLGYLVYSQTGSKPPSDERAALIKEPRGQKREKAKMTTKSPDITEQTETPEEQSAGMTYESTDDGSTNKTDTHKNQSVSIQTTATTSNQSGSASSQTPPEPQSPSQNGATEQPEEPTIPATNNAPSCELEILSDSPLLAGAPVRFQAAYSDSDGKIVKVTWSLGDGNSLEHGPDINIIQHVYSTSGTYTVTLTVFDDKGATAQVSKTLTITTINQGPITNFSDNAPKKAGEPVTFHNKSYDPDGFIVEVKWDFGDGNTSTEKNPTHIYNVGGTYQVTLTVTDDHGATSSLTKSITIFKADPCTVCP